MRAAFVLHATHVMEEHRCWRLRNPVPYALRLQERTYEYTVFAEDLMRQKAAKVEAKYLVVTRVRENNRVRRDKGQRVGNHTDAKQGADDGSHSMLLVSFKRGGSFLLCRITDSMCRTG